METNYTFRNLSSTDSLKLQADEKLQKLKRYLIKPGNAHVIFSLDGHEYVVEITLSSNGVQYVGKEKTHDMYVSLHSAVEKIEKQLKKQKERVKNHKPH